MQFVETLEQRLMVYVSLNQIFSMSAWHACAIFTVDPKVSGSAWWIPSTGSVWKTEPSLDAIFVGAIVLGE